MSLLMDALKKADATKRQAEDQAASLSLEPLATASAPTLATTDSPLPDLALHFDAVDADLASHAAAPTGKQHTAPPLPHTASQLETPERVAVRNVFAAKSPPSQTSLPWLPLSIGTMAAVGIGAYFWWQLQALPTSTLHRPPVVATPIAAVTPTELEQSSAPVETPVTPSSPPATAKPTEQRPTNVFPPAASKPARPTPPAAPPSALFAAETSVHFSRSQAKTEQPLERAYAALQAGRLDEAQHGYEAILRHDGKNTDALLGLASIATRIGQDERAQTFYQRAYESDPSNATAQAGLLNNKGQTDAAQTESRLKTALSKQPNAPALHFALGNLYARQERWSEAQQAYFNAYSVDPDNPDFIVNLAISLDHLHQSKLAAQYYRMALAAAETRRAAFDAEPIKARLRELPP